MLALGDVMRHSNPQLIGVRPTGRPHDVHDLPVFAYVTVFEMSHGVSGHDLRGHHLGPCTIFGEHHLYHDPANHFGRRITEDALTGGTGEHKATLRVDRADGI